jgi:hypothetical protein
VHIIERKENKTKHPLWLKPNLLWNSLTPGSCLAIGEPRRIRLGFAQQKQIFGLQSFIFNGN